MKKQAVVILHGMGEQLPMETLNSFVQSVWTTDSTLTDSSKPDPNTGQKRDQNAAWAKPDARNTSSELRRITTESDKHGKRTDFYEYYWAHLMHGTTWEQVKTWLADLLWRNPFKRVPQRLLPAWIVLWVIAAAAIVMTVIGFIPSDDPKGPLAAIFIGLGSVVISAFISNIMVKRFGDVARYVKAKPLNVARRQEIRSNGVQLLDRLIKSDEYDRIIVVAHSLGAIVAYDILTELYARYNKQLDKGEYTKMKQPERHKLEEMLRNAAGLKMDNGELGDGKTLDLDAFQTQQAAVLKEAQSQGSDWIISDFLTIGSPLVHAEFLLADSEQDLRDKQSKRLFPTCPPTLEYDGTTKLHHFSYDPQMHKGRKPLTRRVPHHAALFACTRWTNIYSDHAYIIKGDIISGPVANAFGLSAKQKTIQGIRDIAVLPELTLSGEIADGHKRPGFSHSNYWNAEKGTETTPQKVPHHIAQLRKALDLLND